MKKTVLLITSLVLMVGCIKSVEDSTLINKSGLMYFKESDEPYSGRSFSKDSEGNIVFKFFYRNGKKIIESDFENSEEGKTIVFYENGQKDTEYEFDLSIKNGIKVKDSFKKWYDNGNKRVEGHYVNGERNGVWTEWDENGQKKVTQYSTPSSPSTSTSSSSGCNISGSKSFLIGYIKNRYGWSVQYLDLLNQNGDKYHFYGSGYDPRTGFDVTLNVVIRCNGSDYTVLSVDYQ
jgi:hypothetical protein